MNVLYRYNFNPEASSPFGVIIGGGLSIVLSGKSIGLNNDGISITGSDDTIKYKSSQLNRLIPEIFIGGSIEYNRLIFEGAFFLQFREYVNFDDHPKNNGFSLSVSYRLR